MNYNDFFVNLILLFFILKSAVLQYLFYLCQIGVATAPSCNHYLYLHYIDHPFYDLHKAGLNLSISSDSPLHLYFSEASSSFFYSHIVIVIAVSILFNSLLSHLISSLLLLLLYTYKHFLFWSYLYFSFL